MKNDLCIEYQMVKNKAVEGIPLTIQEEACLFECVGMDTDCRCYYPISKYREDKEMIERAYRHLYIIENVYSRN